MYISINKRVILLLLTIIFVSCGKDFLTVDPPKTQLISEKAFESDAVATTTVTGIYSRMVSGSSGFASGGIRSISLMAGLCSDELINFNNNTSYNDLFNNAINPEVSLPNNYCWNELYQYIYTTNSILEHLEKADRISTTTKDQLKAEAKFIRAFCYFYLTNLYGDLPLYTNTDYTTNKKAVKTPAEEVYKLIIDDLTQAYNALPSDYTLNNGNRSRPIKWTAAALLSRVYLYIEDWEKAETYASVVIDNPLFELVMPDEVFLANSKEVIWHLARDNGNALDASVLSMTDVAVTPSYASLRDTLFADADPSDTRLNSWINKRITTQGSFLVPQKYKMINPLPITEHTVVFRLAEQYLIRAEARAQQPGKLTGLNSSESDLNIIRSRAVIDDVQVNGENEMLKSIAQERVYELFSEWGHRWFDLKRTGRANEVLSIVKGENWQPEDALFPVPTEEILRNGNIIQNLGY